eukprot:Filipodium_phascolosomae@DN7261_c0_g1_i1.p1
MCPPNHFCPGGFNQTADHSPAEYCGNGTMIQIGIDTPYLRSHCVCKPGWKPAQSGLTCELCPPGSFRRTPGNYFCTDLCPDHSTSFPGASSDHQCFCRRGFYNELWNEPSGEQRAPSCVACGVGAICSGGFVQEIQERLQEDNSYVDIHHYHHVGPHPIAGYYKPSQNSSEMISCYIRSACLGGPDNECHPHQMSFLCDECQPGYHKESSKHVCIKCFDLGTEFLLSFLVIIWNLILALLITNMFRVAGTTPGVIHAVILRIGMN